MKSAVFISDNEIRLSEFTSIAKSLLFMKIECSWKTFDDVEEIENQDLYIISLKFPYTFAFEALKKIRERHSNSIILALAEDHDIDHMLLAKEKGFNGYISKFFDLNKIRTQIENIIEGYPVWEI